MQVYIMRGIPGSGKSTYVRNFVKGYVQDGESDIAVCTADDYHIKNGQYRFDPAKVGEAHDACLSKFLAAVKVPTGNRHPIFVDNTNLQVWEIAPYYRIAQVFGWDTSIVLIPCPFEVAAGRQTHSVPLDRLWQMYQTLLSERLPPHWKQVVRL